VAAVEHDHGVVGAPGEPAQQNRQFDGGDAPEAALVEVGGHDELPVGARDLIGLERFGDAAVAAEVDHHRVVPAGVGDEVLVGVEDPVAGGV
jgi:hypothetical protein